ncbi:MAG: cytochrome c [Bdellovibrionales bacterium]|nr:cytochrome c [Bdellovibrionales bacterium]
MAVPETPLIARGRATYQTFCIACHNSDPRKPGAVGPDVAFSTPQLIELRIMEAKYPPGYTPKRPGGIMPAMPQLKDEIEGLVAYLNALKRK